LLFTIWHKLIINYCSQFGSQSLITAVNLAHN